MGIPEASFDLGLRIGLEESGEIKLGFLEAKLLPPSPNFPNSKYFLVRVGSSDYHSGEQLMLFDGALAEAGINPSTAVHKADDDRQIDNKIVQGPFFGVEEGTKRDAYAFITQIFLWEELFS